MDELKEVGFGYLKDLQKHCQKQLFCSFCPYYSPEDKRKAAFGGRSCRLDSSPNEWALEGLE